MLRNVSYTRLDCSFSDQCYAVYLDKLKEYASKYVKCTCVRISD